MKTIELPQNPKFETSNCRFYETEVEGYDKKLLVQVLKEPYPNMDDMVYLKNDYEICHEMDPDNSLKALDMVITPNGFVVYKENFEGIPMAGFILNKEFSIPLFLQISIRLTRLLQSLHKKKLLIKELTIENLLISPETLEIKICSLGSASRLTRERPEFNSEFKYYGPLMHVSPEQTGRIGRTVDYRSDYYSLGVIFYQILCWRKPFNYTDSLELIHAHIAKQPLSPKQIKDSIPAVISNLVMKLMSKDSEDRYQSEVGIISDLEHCLHDWQTKGKIEDFSLGSKDQTNLFSFSEKLYGRKEELDVLMQAWKRIGRNQIELLLVAGYSGIGKTRLINEIRKPVIESNGYFVYGKFDQFTKEKPFSAFGNAFNFLLQEMLSEAPEKLIEWEEQFQRIVGSNAGLLTEVIEDLEKLIGPQEAVLDIGSFEGRDRFFNTFVRFLEFLESLNKPLLVFIDDLQWADSGSLNLIHTIVSQSLKNILIVGAYRDNEVNESHPLSMTIHHLYSENKGVVSQIKLSELQMQHVNQLIADSLHHLPKETVELSTLVWDKTRGNPFFVKQFIEKLLEENAVRFDEESLKWTWDIRAIENTPLTDYVVDIILVKLKKMSVEAQELIKLCACIGNTFHLDTLSHISFLGPAELADNLQELIRNEFISPIGSWQIYHSDNQWLADDSNAKVNYKFRFQHDRFQQAAYDMIPEANKKATHLQIGRTLWKTVNLDDDTDLLFDLLNHLNQGVSLIEDEGEKLKLAQLNFNAGRKAKKNNAIKPALIYFGMGMDLLGKQQASELFKEMLINRSECEYLLGNYSASEELFDKALENANTKLDKADTLCRKMALYENTQRHEKALEAAQQGLSLLGMHLPLNAGQLHVMKELLTVKFLLRKKTPETLLQNKNMVDPEKVLTMKILMNLWGPCYLLQKQNLLAFKILRMVNLSIRYGNSIESALAYAFYGYVISAQLGDYKNGYAFAGLGKMINSKFNDKSLRSKVLVIAEGCVAHWQKPYSSYLQELREAHHVGVESNDIIYAGYAVTFLNRSQFIMGENLNTVYEKLQGYIQFALNIHSSISYHQMLSWARIIQDLRSKDKEETIFGKLVDEEDHLNTIIEMTGDQNLPLPLANYYTAKSIYNTLMGDFEQAFTYAEKAGPIMASVLGLPEWPEQKIFYYLSASALLIEGKTINKKQKKEMQKNLDFLKSWAENNPDNYSSKYSIALAEDLVIKKQYQEAELMYDLAFQQAKDASMNYMKAYALERKANLYFIQNERSKAIQQLRFSVIEYNNWGAENKVISLQSKFQHLDADHLNLNLRSTGLSSSSLDLKSVLQAAASISEEVKFEKLLEKLLRVVIESAGAQCAYLFRVHQNKIMMEASSKMEDGFVCEINSIPLEELGEVSHSIVRKVFNTNEHIIIADLKSDPNYSTDQQLINRKAKSVLCFPILSKGQLSGVLYLDNDASAHTFTVDRLELLKLLSGQMAVSLENSLLYENLEQKVLERTITIENQKAELETEKSKSDSLLLNILPEEIARELKDHGISSPKKHNQATIMFTDFENFTKMAEKLNPEQLIEFLNQYYKSFDQIIKKYNIEKIKTIGDAYMCVSGVPLSDEKQAEKCVQAAFEILDFVKKQNAERAKHNLPYCEIRIGIHTGAIIAGVVGLHKFAYDIWGEAVNTASRMEGAGEAGKINISYSSYELVKDKYPCEYRGKIEMKHGIEIDMYFVKQNNTK